jgi:hypothetical protein
MELRVVDTGQGISAEFLPHVFERFPSGDEATTQRHTGLGLGLGIVRSSWSCMGGPHAASPGVGHGATFTVRLPVSAGDAQSGRPVAPAERRIASSTTPPSPRLHRLDGLRTWLLTITLTGAR